MTQRIEEIDQTFTYDSFPDEGTSQDCWSTWEKWVNESWWKETCFRWMKQCDEDEEGENDRRRDGGLKQDEEDADTKRWRR